MENTLKCTNCNESLKPHWKICPNCQQPVQAEQTKKCPYCGEEQRDETGKCIGCGKTIEEAKAEVQVKTTGKNTTENYLCNNEKRNNMNANIIDKNKFFSKIKEQEIAEEQEKMAEKEKALQVKFRDLVASSRSHIMNGEFTKALNEAKKALDINSSSVLAAHPHSLIAEVYLKQNRLDEAITEINEALKFNDKYWYALCVCAKIYYVGKDYKQMRNYYFQALSSVKEKELVLKSLSDIPNIDEIIANIENDEDEDDEDLDFDRMMEIQKRWR
jgi:tetratricopeptide (TPR) repeat protein